MKYCMIETAFDNEEELNNVVEKLLSEKLVCSCQVIKSNSKWRWDNKLEKSEEYLLFMKTKNTLQEKVYLAIKQFHSYDCFEFAVFEMSSINNDYLNWIEKETI